MAKNQKIQNFLIVLVVILFLTVFVLSMKLYTLTGSKLIPASQAKRLIKSGQITQILDIRTKVEYDLGHYPGSIHIPVNKINKETVKNLKIQPHLFTVTPAKEQDTQLIN